MRKQSITVLLAMLGFVVSATNAAASDPLTERGIDPQILDVMVSDLSQGIGYRRLAEIEVTTNEGTFTDRALIEFEPDTAYGIDLIMRFEGDSLETGRARQYRSTLEDSMRLQHRVRTLDAQYDPESLVVESQDGSKAVIRFRYSGFALPQQVAWMRHLQGRIWIDGDRVKQIRLELDEGRSFVLEGTRVREFESVARFTRLTSGRDVIQETESRVAGTRRFRRSQEVTVVVKTSAISFTEAEGRDVTPANIEAPAGINLDDFDNTVRVKLDRRWPIFGKEARRRGFEVPKPFGISGLYSDITTKMHFTSFEINGESQVIEAIFDPNGSGIDIDAESPQLRADWFPVPFVNLMALYGKAKADGRLLINTTDLGQLVGLPEIIEESIEIDTDMYGVGITVAAGYKNFFGNVTATYFKSVTSDADTDSTIMTVTPMVGYFFPDYRLRVIIGAEYFDIENKMVGSIDLGGGNSLDFNIGVETEEWAGRVGVYKEFGNSFEGTLTYTYGADRDGISAMFGYRF